MEFIADLKSRGLVADCTHEDALRKRLDHGGLTVYCGFDPTADSLHVGHLLALRMLWRFQQAGHTPIVLIGGATGFIGDPSGRRTDRVLLSASDIDRNVEGLREQVIRLLPKAPGKPAAKLVDNREWFTGFEIIDFLREVGVHFPVNTLLNQDSVKLRRESTRDEEGLTFAELAYSLLQAQDFKVLRERHGCELQIGGSDQWSNILGGLRLMQRHESGSGFGLTWPLLLKANGEKFGKSGSENVWLSPKRTSPFDFFQFWMNAPDNDIEMLLLRFSELPEREARELLNKPAEARHAQRHLAKEMTTWVHGDEVCSMVQHVSGMLFDRNAPFFGNIGDIDEATIDWLSKMIPTHAVSLTEASDQAGLMQLIGLSTSRGEAKRLLESGGFVADGIIRITPEVKLEQRLREKGWLVLTRGKRTHHLVRLKR